MPQYNGPISFVFEVLAHLLWCYFIFALTYLIFAGALFALLGAKFGGFVLVAGLAASNPTFSVGMLHFMTMVWFTVYFAPRFRYTTQLLTFVLAMSFGAMIVTSVWALNHLGTLSDLGEWAAKYSDDLAETLLMVIATSVAAGLFGKLMHGVGVGGFLWGPGRWVGWVIVGRDAYEAFVAEESERLRRAYDDHIRQIRKQ